MTIEREFALVTLDRDWSCRGCRAEIPCDTRKCHAHCKLGGLARRAYVQFALSIAYCMADQVGKISHLAV